MEEHKIIVYRSQTERDIDEFWHSPEGQSFILWGAGLFLVAVILYVIATPLYKRLFKRGY